MALPWLAALKLIPWTDVIAAAPQVVKSAQKLYDSVKNRPKPSAAPTATDASLAADSAPLDADMLQAHVHALQMRLDLLEQEQRSSSELIRDLAQHNERLVSAVETLRLRSRFLLRLGYALLLSVIVLAVLLARH
jgi:hypothetical protein